MPGRLDRGGEPADVEFHGRLVAAQSGEEWAVAAIFRDHNPSLLRYLRAQEMSAADDLAAEVWLAVASTLTGFRGGASAFRAWLFTIAHRRLIDYRRRAARRLTDPVANGQFAERAAADDPAQTVIDHLSAQATIGELVSHLSAEQAEVVLLRVIAGLDAAQVAEAMGRSTGWVRVTQHRALRHLASRWDGLVTR